MLNLKATISYILHWIKVAEVTRVKSNAFSATTSAAGTATFAGLAGHTIVGVAASSVAGSCYAVIYQGNSLGFFNYAAPHAPLANTTVTVTLYYI